MPLDRNAKVRVMMVPRAQMRHQEKRKGLRQDQREGLAVLTVLLWRFHNAATGKCFPVIRGDRRGRRLRQEHGVRGDPRPRAGRPSCPGWTASSAFASTSPGLFGNPVQRRCAERGRRQRFQSVGPWRGSPVRR